MADNQETITNLTEATLHLVDLQLRQKRIALNSQEAEQIKEEIKNTQKNIQVYRDLISIQARTYKDVEREIAQKKAIDKETQKTINLIKQMGLARKAEAKAIEDIQRSMKISKKYDTSITLSTIGKDLKALNFSQLKGHLTDAGGKVALLSNTIKSLGGAGTVLGGVLFALAKAGQMFHDNVFMPFAQRTNIVGQTLGIGYEGRRYFQTDMFKQWMEGISLGYSPKEYTQMFGVAAGIQRESPEKIGNMVKQLGIVNRLWGTDINTLSPIFKAYRQGALKGQEERLAGHFNLLMKNIEGTGFTTQEFTDVLANSAMYLKNFGVNLDGFAAKLKGYGKYVEEGKISLAALTPQNVGKAETGQMAFLAQMLQKYGFKDFGLSATSRPEAWARALKQTPMSSIEMREYLKQIALTPGSELYGMFGGIKNKRELELTIAEAFDTYIQKIAGPYDVGVGNMLASEFFNFSPDIAQQQLTGTETAPADVYGQAVNAQFMGASISGKATQVLGAMAQIVNVQAQSVKACQTILNKITGGKVQPITSTSGGSNANT